MKLTLPQLEQHLAQAAWILKGPVDAADFKVYVFPLLFFKRLSDVYDDEYKKLLEESKGDEGYAVLPEFHRFIIPDGCHWADVRATTKNVGAKLQYAFREIEKANPDFLYGIFGDAQWTNKEKLPDSLLVELIEHFSEYKLANGTVDLDMLGQAYEYLIKKFADLTNKKAGEFYTPRTVVQLMGRIIDPKEGETVYDPACGTGGMLLNCVEHLRSHGKDARTLKIFGQEKNLTTSSIARMNMFLHDVQDFQIQRGDTLRSPAYYEGDQLSTFDCVIANPPFSLKKWGDDLWIQDPYGRNFAGVPPAGYGDYAWVQHMIKSMSYPRGRIAVVLPHGALFRKGREGQIRKKIIETDALEAVIGLGPNIFYGATVAACILVFRANKPDNKEGKVLFIDASDQVRVDRAQNYLEQRHVDQIFDWYSAFKGVKDHAVVATLKDIAANDWSLNISLYIEKISGKTLPSVEEATKELKNSLEEVWEAETELKRLLDGFSLISK
ncbi:MAG: DNA methylase [Candidatus Lloydbacteria bacterium RIFCSPHIGHO2_01_FULL_49_22]|uniref:site-specific DNA-methyltransferase (adenine-specific) n=1 Tax=Candidatus Lloydbacteria bacterium RIFCSPHIGHO2_01_FULL_49_22 TaxID=1798658 RepID=A0A1G2CYC7_9BACT|nr:MAG: DNA methylase [Candidatus Lloydbacteria bacterium RIFCSPHIGHO2_01_FULL_49_22]OGZ09781.1 MAG: DNA methylase [Candidatus Lloydbacteria bacterium RIFCSPHIGHO2_02_FULL_50_18]